MNSLEKRVAKYFGRKYCVITGSGTTSMNLFFRAIPNKGTVMFPAITCIQAINSAIFAKFKIAFSDVSINDYTMNFKNFKNALNPKIKVVVPTHTFGHSSEIKKIADYCKKNNILVLEDATQSLGGKIGNKKTGSFGDASVISFGHSKIIDCGNGGAILTDQKKLYLSMKKYYEKIPSKIKNYGKYLIEYRKNYYSIRDRIKNKYLFCNKILKIQKKYKNLFIYKANKSIEKRITNKFKDIKTVVKKRNFNHNLYKKNLKNQNIIIPKINSKSVSWRFTFLVKKNRDILIQKIRKHKIDISCWYPSLHYLKNYDKKKYKNSIKIDKGIVNLWTHQNMKEKIIKKNIKIINQYL